MLNYKWKICNGQTKELFDHFKSTTFFEEKQIYAEGLIQNIEQFYLSPKDAQLISYMQSNKTAYEEYWKSIVGEHIAIPQTTYYIQQYINENNLMDDFHKFIERNYHLFINYKSKQEILQTLIDKVMQPLFIDARGQYFFIYRDRDNKGIYVERPSERKLNDLLELLLQFRKLLSYCIVNYNPENGDKKRILDMIQKISNFREIYFIQPTDYTELIDLFNRIKISLRNFFNPNPFLEQLDDIIEKILNYTN